MNVTPTIRSSIFCNLLFCETVPAALPASTANVKSVIKAICSGTLNLYKKTAPDWMLKALAKEVDTFIECYKDRLDDEFNIRYAFDFSPKLWNSTPFNFLMTLRRLAAHF